MKKQIKTIKKSPLSYYGGKHTLAPTILPLFPANYQELVYVEPFFGGGSLFFLKEPSKLEVINDTNKAMVNFYRTVQNDFTALEKEIRITLHSRDLHRKARVIYENPDMFNELKQAWAVFMLANTSFSSMLDGSFGYDKKKACMPKKLQNKKVAFTEEYAIRLQNVTIECADALRIITSRDSADAFFYCDPPYYNSDCGHYDGYSLADFENLLKTLSKLQGRFMLSSYQSPILSEYTKANGWHTKEYKMKVSVNNVGNTNKPKKEKTEVVTWNYEL